MKLSAQDSIDTALFIKTNLPTGDLASDATSLAMIDSSVELLMEKYAQCDLTLTTPLPSKNFDSGIDLKFNWNCFSYHRSKPYF